MVGGGQLRGSTKDVGVTTAASGCEYCNGRGWIPASDVVALLKAGIENPRLAEKDPYSLPMTPEQAARMHRKAQERRTNP